MGLFSNKTETYAYLGSSSVLEPENYVDSIKSAIISGSINDNESIPQNILFGTKAGFQLFVEKFIKYGYDKYVYPPPVEYQIIIRDETDSIKAAIASEEGVLPQDITISKKSWTNFRNYLVGDLGVNHTNYTYFWLQENRPLISPSGKWFKEYDTVQFEQTTTVENPAYDPDLPTGPGNEEFIDVNIVFDNSSLRSVTGFNNPNITLQVFVYFSEEEDIYPPPGITEYLFDSYNIRFRTYYYVEYTVAGDSKTRYWVYDINAETYPSILGMVAEIKTIRNWVPVVFFQKDKVPWDQNPNNPWYNSNIELMDELGLDANEVWQSFKNIDSQGAEIWDMFFHFGCPINNSSDPKDRYVCQQYLYHLFYGYYLNNGTGEGGFYLNIGGPSGYDNGYKWRTLSYVDYSVNKPNDFGDWKASAFVNSNDEGVFTFSCWAEIFDPFTNDTLYREIKVIGLQQSILTNTNQGLRLAYVRDWQNLYMELRPDLFREIRVIYKERFLQACLRGTVVLVEEIDIPWYQSGFWKAVFAIVVVVIAVALFQWQLAGTAATLFSISGIAISWQTLSVLAFTIFLSYTASFVYGDSLFGKILVFIASFIAVGGLTTLSNINLQNILNQGFGTAVQALKTVTTIADFTLSYYQKEKIEALKDEYEDLVRDYKQKQEELEAYYYSLGIDNADVSINPITDIVKKSNSYIQETPDEFIQRTVNPNPGEDMIQIISNFTDITLSLPKRPGQKNALEGIVEMISGPRGYI